MTTALCTPLLVLALAAGAANAHERDPLLGPLLGGIVQERDVGLFFGYMREALDAAIEGRETSPPAELAQRAEEIGEAVKRRGAAAARSLLDSIETTVREGVRRHERHERHDRQPPPTYPRMRI